MQLIQTNVHSGDDTSTVEFLGEGGEKVLVYMVRMMCLKMLQSAQAQRNRKYSQTVWAMICCVKRWRCS